LTVPDPVNDQAEQDDTDGEGPDARTEEDPALHFIKAELLRPNPAIDQDGTYNKGHGCCDQCNEGSPKNNFVVPVVFHVFLY
jgi:hypothetical protein